MRAHHGVRCVAAMIVIAATGCTTLREIPRAQYAARPERGNVRIVTRDGLVYEFDFARFANDSLVGFRRRDTEGRFDELASIAVSLDEVAQLSSRGIDWKRTGMVGGGVALGVVAAGLAKANQNDTPPRTSAGGSGRPPN